MTNAHKMMSTFKQADVGVIITWSNNIVECTFKNRKPAQVVPDLLKRFVVTYPHTRRVLVPMFLSFDLPWNDGMNCEIGKKANTIISKVARRNHVKVLNTKKTYEATFHKTWSLDMSGKSVGGGNCLIVTDRHVIFSMFASFESDVLR